MKKEEQIQLANNLKALLEQRNQTFTQVARKLGINHSTLHNWLCGAIPSPLIALVRLANYFELSLDELCLSKATEKHSDDCLIVYLKVDKELKIVNIETGSVKSNTLPR